MTITSKRPNFLIIVADDLGFSDLSPFGGEIHTPNLYRLATENGVRLIDFHTASACSPTRSMLLSGTDNHIAGLGQMAEFAVKHERFKDQPGYEGYLNDKVAALSEILQDDGYHTWLSGKWHLGLKKPYWPHLRGFTRSWTLLPGAGNHFKYVVRDEKGELLPFLPSLYVDGERQLDADTELPEDFYSTTAFTDKAIEFIDGTPEDKSFFGLLTYTAPHWPYQAPQDRIAKYNGVYAKGPEDLRRKRLAQAVKLGLIDEKVIPHPIKTVRKRWEELTDEEKAIEQKIVQTYAAMVEILDENVGRVLDHSEVKGELENTFVLFMSDNGADGKFMEALPLAHQRVTTIIDKYYDNSLENIGKYNSFTFYGDQWAQAATAPHAMYKAWSTEGGIVTPVIISYPPLLKNSQGQIFKEFTTVMDILPTVLELAGVEHPGDTFRGRPVAKPRGKSWVKYLSKQEKQVHNDDTVTGWELFGQQAIRKAQYKAVFIPKPFGPEKWQLFNIIKDPGETTDLAETEPNILEELTGHWAVYAAETGLIELGSEFFENDRGDDQEREDVYRIILDS
ncbi:Arylsulfatase [Candida viswanathii]|uniref:Arylsulfatase n=1 Tax=Candida viswanathii TaxID=5486 RepID=A0A367YFS3_9ASCO|nr:Arylsulfatase [Candida viswanathii]